MSTKDVWNLICTFGDKQNPTQGFIFFGIFKVSDNWSLPYKCLHKFHVKIIDDEGHQKMFARALFLLILNAVFYLFIKDLFLLSCDCCLNLNLDHIQL